MDHPMNVVLVTQLGLLLPLRPRPLPPVQVFSYVISTTLTCTLPESQTSCNARGLPVVASFPPGLAVLPAANSCPYGVERRLKRAKHASCICPILSVLILTMHGNISLSFYPIILKIFFLRRLVNGVNNLTTRPAFFLPMTWAPRCASTTASAPLNLSGHRTTTTASTL